MIIFCPAALVMMSFSLEIWKHELGRALILCATVWLVISLIVIVISLWQTRSK
jgi:ABC-type nickel/cobalt efflux system permease component RcnA